MSRKIPEFEILTRSNVERMANILGPSSAAAQTLEKAAEYLSRGSEVVFVLSGQTIGVVCVPDKHGEVNELD